MSDEERKSGTRSPSQYCVVPSWEGDDAPPEVQIIPGRCIDTNVRRLLEGPSARPRVQELGAQEQEQEQGSEQQGALQED